MGYVMKFTKLWPDIGEGNRGPNKDPLEELEPYV